LRIDILTIFPEAFLSVLNYSILKRAQEKGRVKIVIHNIRDYAPGKHKEVDGKPYGGGPGMVLKIEPIYNAIEKLGFLQKEILFPTPRGKVFCQSQAQELAQKSALIFLCGHYEGIDERVYKFFNLREISLGNYILTGGELAVMVIIDAVVRLIPGVLGNIASLREESFTNSLLEYPQYTSPREFKGESVPEVLLSGAHKRIHQWRVEKALEITKQKRPDLLKNG
jgi:tRNA (guanine37-N1)-methyltransferase